MDKEEKNLRILVIDENPADSDLIEKYLREADFSINIKVVRKLKEAAEIIQKFHPDVIILNLGIPDSSGFDSLRKTTSFMNSSAVIVLTELEDREVGKMAIKLGAQDYLAKCDINSPALLKSVEYSIERLKTLNSLKEATLMFRQTFENIADVVCTFDNEMKFTSVSPSITTNFGYSPEELIGKTFKEKNIIHPDDIEKALKEFIEVLKGKTLRNLQYRIFAKDRSERTISLSGSPLGKGGKCKGVAIVVNDITESKQVEEMKRGLAHADRLMVIGQLAAGVAHEINNPAAYVMANISNLGKAISDLKEIHNTMRDSVEFDEPERMKEKMQLVLGSGDFYKTISESEEVIKETLEGVNRIRSIVKDLRIFSRLEEDRLEYTSINEIIDVAANMTFNEVKYKARLEKNYSKLPQIVADKGKLAQVIVNMLLNSAQAITKGSINENKIRISTRTENQEILITIEDTGCGIPENIIGSIFEPFFTTKPKEMGTGLGLALCADIIHKHNGKITIRNTSEKGTCIEISLPLESALSKKGPVTQKEFAMAHNRRTILLIDDETLLLKAYKRYLESDYFVITKESAEAAFELLEKEKNIDLILCDVIMPGMSGVDFYKKLKNEMPMLAKRLIFCSGSGFGSSSREIRDIYDNVFIEKPISMLKLKECIEREINKFESKGN